MTLGYVMNKMTAEIGAMSSTVRRVNVMLLLSSDVQMRRVLTSIGNVMGTMTARMVLTNRIVGL